MPREIRLKRKAVSERSVSRTPALSRGDRRFGTGYVSEALLRPFAERTNLGISTDGHILTLYLTVLHCSLCCM
jgi:hypothetical protein